MDANSHEIEYRCANQPKLHSVASAVLASQYIHCVATDLGLYKQAQAFANIIAKEHHDLQEEARIG